MITALKSTGPDKTGWDRRGLIGIAWDQTGLDGNGRAWKGLEKTGPISRVVYVQ